MDGTYAPQSPDLTSFFSSSPKTSQQLHYQPNSLPQQPQQQQSPPQTASSSYAPRSPVLPSFASAPLSYQQPSYNPNPHGDQGLTRGNEFGEYSCGGYMPPIPNLPPSHSFSNLPTTSPYLSHQSPIKSEADAYADLEQVYIPSPTMSTRNPRGRLPKGPSSQPSSSANPLSFASAAPAADRKNPNPDNIEIKTKFPVARIKRIMQADEEVGKVAQVTPVAVNKALELFMIQLVQGAATIAKDKGGKRVTAQHLKQVVESDQQFDFLQEIVAKVGDGQEGAGGETKKRKGDSDSEEGAKPKKGRGRKKKASGDD